MPEDLKKALPAQDPNDTTPAGTEPAVIPPTVSPETQKILDTLNGINEQVQGLTASVEEIQARETTPPAEPEPEPEPAKWTPKGWDDFPTLVETKAQEIVDRTLKEKEDAKVKTEKAQVDEQTRIDNDIDTNVSRLETEGKIPKIVKADDVNDPGRSFRRELYGLASKMETLNLDMVSETLNTMHKQGIHYDFKANKWLRSAAPNPGQNVPVGSSNSSGGGVVEGPSYDTIHKSRSLSELARRAGG